MISHDSYLESLSGKPSISIEMVCLGNICRSPLAAAVLHNKALEIEAPKIVVSSSGTSNYHIGEGAHKLSVKTWQNAGYKYDHTARQFSRNSFGDQDLILAMDLTNRAMILNAAQSDEERAKVFTLRQFDPQLSSIDPTSRSGELLQVPDPWGETIDSYEKVLEMVERAVDGLIARLTA
jgi:protein-tyrosine phosphatase